MASGLNWDRAKRRDRTRDGQAAHRAKPTHAQLRLLISLRRKAGDPEPDARLPRSLAEASAEISRLKEGKTSAPRKNLAADIERSVARRVQDSS